MRFVKTALLGLALALGAGSALAADKLIVGNEGTYPPFSMMLPDGKLDGIEPELVREMCKRLALECEFSVMDFQALIPSLLQGKIDMLGSQLTPLPERKAKMLFALPIIFNHDAFVIRKDKDYDFADKASFKGVRIGVQSGTPQAKYVTATYGDVLEPTLYTNPDQMRLDLLAGRLDMVFGANLNWTSSLLDKPEGKDWRLAGFTVWTGDPTTPEAERGSSWAAPKGQEALVEKMNAALKAMLADCTFTTIRAKYLSVPISPDEAACVAKAP
jgi:ABC-type amino acid transport substrate-binding protein